MTRPRFLAETAAIRVLFGMANLLPRRALLALGSAAGLAWYALDPRHRRVAAENLRAAFGDALPPPESRRIVRRCWSHYGRTLLDTLAFERFSPASAGSLVRYEGLDHVRAAYRRGRGVLVFSAHFGHWELVALMQGHLGMPLHMVTRPLDNPALESLLRRLRAGSGNTVVHRRNAVREMLLALRGGEGVAILIDQDAHAAGVFVPFFGRPASTTRTLALLALKTGAAVIPVFSVPEDDTGYRVVYEPPVEIRDTGDREHDVRTITEDCTRIIERWVRLHPELWLWMHRRWKTPPPEIRDGRES